jgi:hypothetical protein
MRKELNKMDELSFPVFGGNPISLYFFFLPKTRDIAFFITPSCGARGLVKEFKSEKYLARGYPYSARFGSVSRRIKNLNIPYSCFLFSEFVIQIFKDYLSIRNNRFKTIDSSHRRVKKIKKWKYLILCSLLL